MTNAKIRGLVASQKNASTLMEALLAFGEDATMDTLTRESKTSQACL
jgi:hypothetical protein